MLVWNQKHVDNHSISYVPIIMPIIDASRMTAPGRQANETDRQKSAAKRPLPKGSKATRLRHSRQLLSPPEQSSLINNLTNYEQTTYPTFLGPICFEFPIRQAAQRFCPARDRQTLKNPSSPDITMSPQSDNAGIAVGGTAVAWPKL